MTMNKKRAVDLILALIWGGACVILYLYPDKIRYSEPLMWATGIAALLFLILMLRDREAVSETVGRGSRNLPTDAGVITEMVLLSEEDTELTAWDMYGKTAMVVGRDVKENEVDIDLSKSPYASMVDIEHAVLNYSSESWYVEDLGSTNGLSVKKTDGKIYKLSADTPCRVERGDCLYVGLNRLLLR